MNVLPVTRQRAVAAATLGVVALFSASGAMAASQSWSASATSTDWTLGTNWVGGAAPGVNFAALSPAGTNATRNTDIATFAVDTPSLGIGNAANPIIWDNTRFIKGITFDTGAGAFHLGTAGGNLLYLDNAGAVTLNAGVTNAQFIDGPVQVRQASSNNGTYTFQNNATSTSATLNFTNPTFTLTSANGRPTSLTLGGSNTGTNTISSSITDASAAQNISSIIKTGLGTWILSGANAFTGTANTGIQINAGVLSARNDAALGTTSTAAANNASINSGGTLEVANGINLSTGLIVNLNTGGTLQSLGSNTVSSTLKVGTAAATVATIQTVAGGDVLSLGDAANDLTGGAADSIINIAGPGTVALNQSSNYAGGFSLNSGTTRLNASNALGAGTGPLNFGAASTAVLQLAGQTAVVGGLNSNATVGTPVIENGNGGVSTLTVNNAAASSFGGLIRDGSGGQVAIAKTGVGSLALASANTYTGGTTISGGTLLANNASGSATGTGSVSVAANGTLGGTGTVGGAVGVASNGRIAPGNVGVGTLRVSTLSLDAGSQLDYDVASAASLDQTIVTTSGGLTINGGTFNLNGGTTAFTANGVYNLIGYTGSINGTGIGALALNSANKNVSTNTYAFGTAGGYVTLTIASSGGTISYWNTDSSSTWSTGPWTPVQPNSVGAFASFGGGGTPITADRTITVDTNKTVGTIAFNQPAGFSYTVAGPGTITLNNGAGNSAFLTDTAGNHAINAPLALTNGVAVTVAQAANTLTLGGTISGTGPVSKGGLGTVAMTGSNTYTGGTTLSAGTLQINSANSLGDVGGALNFTGGTLQILADVTTTRTYNTDPSGTDVKIDTNGHVLTQNGTIAASSGSNSGLTKSGSGTLVLGGVNTYSGPTTINGGTVSVSANNNLGDDIIGAGVVFNGGTLATTATMGLDNLATSQRAVTVNAAGGTLDVAGGTNLTIYSLISGAGTLTKTNSGTLLLYNTANTAALNLAGGTVTAATNATNTNGGLGTGPLTLQGGVVVNSLMAAANTLGLGNAITVPTGQTATFNTPNRFSLGGTLSGGGTLNFGVTTTLSRFDFNGNYTAFTGNINLTGSGNARLFSNGGAFNANSFQSTTLDLGGTVFITPVTNSTGNTYLIGALTGTSATAGLGGGSAGSPNYTVGGLNTSTTFNGLITGNAILTKTGSGSLTLTNGNSYTGLTNLNGGTLVINGQFALGGALYAGTTFNGGALGYVANLPGTNGNGDITADSGGVAKPVTLLAGGGTVNTNGNTVSFANPITGTGAFTKAGAGTLTLNGANTYAGATNVTGGTLVSGPANTTGLLANASGINVANGQIVLDYTGSASPAAAIRGLLAGSFTNGGGVMTTGQIRSSTATAARGLGYRDDAGASQITIKATLFGDADLDGGVSINDFNALAGNFGQSTGKVWTDGDFDYDGGVSINDFNLLAGNFGQSLPAGSDAWAGLVAFAVAHNDLAAFQAVTGVPEPTSLGLIAAGATLGLRRRRRSA